MNQPNILIVSVDFLPRIGGISTMIHHVANSLVQEGAQVTVLAPKGSSVPSHYDCQYELIVDESAKPNLRSGKESRIETKRIESVLRDIHRSGKYTHVFLMHPFYYGEATARFCSQEAVHLTSFFYGYELNSVIAGHLPWLHRIAEFIGVEKDSLRYKTKEIIRRSNQIATISRFTAQLVKKAVPKAYGKVFITGCGISLEDFNREVHLSPEFVREDRVARRRRMNLPSGPAVGFTGRLVPSKNVRLLIEAISQLDGVNLIVIGDGPLREDLERLASRLGVDTRIIWLGSASEETKWEVLRSIDVLVLPSIELPDGQVEGFGIVLLEATAAGSPVIAGNSGGMTDVIADGVNGFLCDTLSPKDLAKKLEKTIRDELLSAQFVTRARDQVSRKYNWRVIATNLLQSIR